MKILFAEPDIGTGGLDAAITSLREGLRHAGVDVLSCKKTDAAMLEGINLVHFHGIWQPRYNRLATVCRKQNIPYVISPHGMLEPWARHHKRWKKWIYFRLAEHRFLKQAAFLFATSAMEKHNLQNLFPKSDIVDIPLGLTGTKRPDYLSARKRLGWDERPVLLYLSRLHEKKGMHLLLEALTQCPDAQQTHLCIVGGGEPAYVERLHHLAKSHANKLPEITWVGEVWGEARWDYFQAADLFCLPSFSENFGLAVLEALQVGTPVLVSDATPWRDFLEEPETPKLNWIVQPEVSSIVHALDAFFSNSFTERAALSDWAWQRFSWEHLIPQYIHTYQNYSQR